MTVALHTEQIRQALRATDLQRAGRLLDEALALAPEEPRLLAQRAMLFDLLGDGEAALGAALAALIIDPGETVAAAMATRWLTDRCQARAAIDVAEACLAVQPDAGHVLRALASALLFAGDAPAARRAADRAVALLPADVAATSTALMACLYDDTMTLAASAARHRELATRLVPAAATRPLAPAARGRIRIGFLSGDFRQHPVGQLIAPVLEQLDRQQFEVFCYADVERPDALTAMLRRLPLHWRDIAGQDDACVLDTMREDGLDMLVDLAGYSHGGRPRVIRGRAAPLQLSWLGYPACSGLPEMDGLIGDAVVLPPSSEASQGERLLRLPLGVFCLQPPEGLPPVSALPMLARGTPTLGSFNHLAKLSDRTVALWARVLRRLPQAQLVLCAIPLLEPAMRAHTLARFVREGVDPARVELRPPQPPGVSFLRQYDDIDLALDPLPFSGGATTLDALRQGVPVVTMPGAGMQTRMSASMQHQLRLDEFVAADEAGYEAIVEDWLGRPEALAALRGGMRRRFAAAAAADGDRYVRDVEQSLRTLMGR